MPSKSGADKKSAKPSAEKRASCPRESGHTKEFKKDWARYNKAGRAPMGDITEVMGLIVGNKGALPAQYRDHELVGDWKGYRECHVHGDLLLVYKIEGNGDDEKAIFVAIGTHSELFKAK